MYQFASGFAVHPQFLIIKKIILKKHIEIEEFLYAIDKLVHNINNTRYKTTKAAGIYNLFIIIY